MTTTHTYGRAAVIGGSIAGLLTARVLSDHFDEVVVIERDTYPDEPVNRSGVPQGHHIHALLTQGRLTFERLLPGIVDEMIADGAILIDHIDDRLRLAPYGWQPRFQSDLRMLLISRTLLESCVRRRVLALGNVSVTTEAAVEGLTEADGTITGVLVDDGGDTDSIVEANLIIDAAGRRSNAPDWLADLGYGVLEETTVDARWGYASRLYEAPDPWPFDWKLINMWPQARRIDAQKTRGGVLCPQDGGRVIVTLVGNTGDVPPRDEAGFAEFAGSLISPEIAEFIADAKPLGPIAVSRTTVNRFRQYDRLEKHPDRFVAIGDALGAFNPVYGQGMSAAAISAETLSEQLVSWSSSHDADLDGFAAQVQPLIAEAVQFPWSTSVSADSRVEGCENALPQNPELNAYVERVIALTSEDPDLVLKFEEMANLVRKNEWMLDPSVHDRVIADWDRLGELVGAPSTPVPELAFAQKR